MLILWVLLMGVLLPLPFILIYYGIREDLVEYPYELEDQIHKDLQGENL